MSSAQANVATPNPQCQALVALLGAEKVLLPGTAGYDASLVSYFSPQAASVRPACFVTPTSADDVAAAVRLLAASSDQTFAVRSGGHTWWAGAGSSPGPGGVTIDLRGLRAVEPAADRRSVRVGAGVTWDAVYAALDPPGLSVAGGRVAGVGVGGLTLGGGISYFGPRAGWACDQPTAYEVVLASGAVVEATEGGEHADLWWGLRGGGNNFGVVTRMDFPTFEQGPLWYALALSSTSEVDTQARIYAGLMAADTYDVDASFVTGWAYVGSQNYTFVTSELVYTRPAGNHTPAVYKPVLDMTLLREPTVVYANMSTLASNSVAWQKPQAARYMSAVTTFAPTEAMIKAAYEAFQASIASVSGVAGIHWRLVIEPLPPQLYNHGGTGATFNALGLGGGGADSAASRGGRASLAVALVSPAWSDAAGDATVYAAARALVADIEARARALDAYDPYIYLAYAAPWQDVIPSYGAENVARLQALRRRVDPNLVFTRQVTGGFKIPE
ncbi:putative oxidoreductase [Xylariaceae sp. FL0804]|nr:putative oxidoreductase [Xylariaceae sp. FL0804]